MTDEPAPQRSADRICFLHIGPHKTGTTSIQTAMYVNAKRLAEIGVYYPTVSEGPGRINRNHTPLARARALRADDLNTAPYWSELGAKIATLPGSIVLSSEHFADVLRDEAKYRKVVDFLHGHGFRVVVVAYVRDQPAWLNSWYTQDQRNFMSRRSFGDFVEHAFEHGLVDPQAFLRRFIDDERVEVRVVSFDLAVKEGLVGSFLTAIGAPETFTLREPKAFNLNLGIKGVYAAQEIMSRVGFRVRSMSTYPQLYEHFKGLLKVRDWSTSAYIGATPEDERRIRERYAQSNDEFARRWLGTDWATACPPRELVQREFDLDTASEEDLRDVLEVVETMVELIQIAAEEERLAGRKPPPPFETGKARGAKPAEASDAGDGDAGEDPAADDHETESSEPGRRRGRKAKGGKSGAGKSDAGEADPGKDRSKRRRRKARAEKAEAEKAEAGKVPGAQAAEGGAGKKRSKKTGAGDDPEAAARKARRKKKKEAAAGLA